MELEWENEYDNSGSNILALITYKPDGNYIIEVLIRCDMFKRKLYFNFQVTHLIEKFFSFLFLIIFKSLVCKGTTAFKLHSNIKLFSLACFNILYL